VRPFLVNQYQSRFHGSDDVFAFQLEMGVD
jgi:hypothetical protein